MVNCAQDYKGRINKRFSIVVSNKKDLLGDADGFFYEENDAVRQGRYDCGGRDG